MLSPVVEQLLGVFLRGCEGRGIIPRTAHLTRRPALLKSTVYDGRCAELRPVPLRRQVRRDRTCFALRRRSARRCRIVAAPRPRPGPVLCHQPSAAPPPRTKVMLTSASPPPPDRTARSWWTTLAQRLHHHPLKPRASARPPTASLTHSRYMSGILVSPARIRPASPLRLHHRPLKPPQPPNDGGSRCSSSPPSHASYHPTRASYKIPADQIANRSTLLRQVRSNHHPFCYKER
jgi:hypothetical protein